MLKEKVAKLYVFILLCNLARKIKEEFMREWKAVHVLRKVHEKLILLTLYLPRFLTEHVSTASRPAGNVTFCIVPSNSGSASNP